MPQETAGEIGLGLAVFRHTVEKTDHAGFQRVLGPDDQPLASLDQLLEDLGAVAQVIG